MSFLDGLLSSRTLLLGISGGALGVSIVGTVLTVLAVYYHRRLWRAYRGLRRGWQGLVVRLPAPLRWPVTLTVGVLGVVCCAVGVVLVPLPGPGMLLILGGIALLDLEFNWIVPSSRWLTNRLPDGWVPARFERGIESIDRA